MRRRSVFCFTLTLALTLSVSTPIAFAKRNDDVVIMKNGDRFTGEIKQLLHGELAFKASYMSAAVELNWVDVARIESKDVFIVSLVDGQQVAGLIQTAGGGALIHITQDGIKKAVPPSDVVELEQSEKTFLHQLTGSVDFGFSVANGNNSADYFTSFLLGYRNKRNEFSLNASSDYNRNDADGTARHTLNLQQRHMFTEQWFSVGLADFLHSEQQELSLRSTFGAGVGRRVFQTPRTRVALIGGVAYTHESYSQNTPGVRERSNGEALLGAQFSTFRFKTLAIGSDVSVFPSLSDPGRVRFVANGDLKIELIRNLYWKFRVYENFDNRPPVNAPRNDAGASSSLGWTF
jgi:putative salt-induced outer membrane protein YdiY